ncbi:hypothetical protein V8F06_006290 [Rhypophila decipiens]
MDIGPTGTVTSRVSVGYNFDFGLFVLKNSRIPLTSLLLVLLSQPHHTTHKGQGQNPSNGQLPKVVRPPPTTQTLPIRFARRVKFDRYYSPSHGDCALQDLDINVIEDPAQQAKQVTYRGQFRCRAEELVRLEWMEPVEQIVYDIGDKALIWCSGDAFDALGEELLAEIVAVDEALADKKEVAPTFVVPGSVEFRWEVGHASWVVGEEDVGEAAEFLHCAGLVW